MPNELLPQQQSNKTIMINQLESLLQPNKLPMPLLPQPQNARIIIIQRILLLLQPISVYLHIEYNIIYVIIELLLQFFINFKFDVWIIFVGDSLPHVRFYSFHLILSISVVDSVPDIPLNKKDPLIYTIKGSNPNLHLKILCIQL